MRFLKLNKWALSAILFLNVSELVDMPFFESKLNTPISFINGYNYTLLDCIFYINQAIGYTSIIPAIALYNYSKTKESKGIFISVCFFGIFELLQEINTLFQLNITLFNKGILTFSDISQLIFINFMLILTTYAYVKWSKHSTS